MKLNCLKSDLVNAISIVSKAVPSKTTMPILECILLDAQGLKITLIGNDLDLGIQTTIEGTIEQRGVAAIEAGIFSSVVRKLPDDTVYLETNGEQLRLSSGPAKFVLPIRDAREFSYLPDIEKNKGISLSEYTFKDIIGKTLFSISDNESNKLMTGELMEVKDGYLKVVSLDGHRVSIRRVELNGSFENNSVVIPGKTLGEVAKILSGDMEKQVQIFFTEKHVLFEFGSTIVVSRLIEGEYFRIDQMLSSDYSLKVTVNKKALYDCIDRAILLVKEQDKKPIILSITEGNLEIRINSTLGSMDENVAITKEGRDMMIGFNPRFLIDALRAIDDEEIDIYFVNPKAPCFIRDEKASYNYVVLPVNFTTIEN